MRKYVVLGLCLVLLLSAVQAFGAGLTGKNEISAAAAWVKVSEDGGNGEITTTLVGASYGRYISENLEFKLDAIYANFEMGGDVNAWLIGPAVAWNFTPQTPSSVIPYIGVGALYANIEVSGSDSSLNLEYFAGAKFFIGGDYTTANKAAFLEYRHTNVSMFDTNVKLDLVWAGLSCFF